MEMDTGRGQKRFGKEDKNNKKGNDKPEKGGVQDYKLDEIEFLNDEENYATVRGKILIVKLKNGQFDVKQKLNKAHEEWATTILGTVHDSSCSDFRDAASAPQTVICQGLMRIDVQHRTSSYVVTGLQNNTGSNHQDKAVWEGVARHKLGSSVSFSSVQIFKNCPSTGFAAAFFAAHEISMAQSSRFRMRLLTLKSEGGGSSSSTPTKKEKPKSQHSNKR